MSNDYDAALCGFASARKVRTTNLEIGIASKDDEGFWDGKKCRKIFSNDSNLQLCLQNGAPLITWELLMQS